MTRPRITLKKATILFEMRRSRLRRKLLSGNSIGGEIVKHQGDLYVAALRDISLDLAPGSRVAVVGRNGAGKTTLLRAMAGVYEPQGGVVSRVGRTNTLFANALSLSDYETGRDNLEVAGVLSGLTVRETQKRMDEVLDITGLGELVEQPVSAYSEGMKTRLGFAVALLSDPEVLLVDEIISGMDIAFIRDIRDRIKPMRAGDGIIVIASHSNEVLRELCAQAVWLERGRIVDFGELEKVLELYDKAGNSMESGHESDSPQKELNEI